MHTIVPILGFEALDAAPRMKDHILDQIEKYNLEYLILNANSLLELLALGPLAVRVPCTIMIAGGIDPILETCWIEEIAEIFPHTVQLTGDAIHISADLFARRDTLSLGGAAGAPRTVREAIKLIYKHIGVATLNVSFIAQHLSVSKSVLERDFTKWKKPGVWKNVVCIRMIEAYNLVRSTKLPIKKIAEGLGYEDDTVFSRAFKEFWGASATVYRKQ